MPTISGARAWVAASVGLALVLAGCQLWFMPKKRESVQPERAAMLGLKGPVEVAVHSPVLSRGGVVRAQGDATNFTGVALATCSVDLRFLDDNGTPVGMATAYTAAGLAPEEKWEFETTTTRMPITDKYYEVVIIRVVATPKP